MDLETLIKKYKCSESAKELIRKTKILFLVGITGAGKDALRHSLMKKGVFKEIVSDTLRAPRVNDGKPEIDGVDYHFIDKKRVLKKISDKEFIEVKYVHGTVYGTSAKEIEDVYRENKVALSDIDVQGVSEYKAISSSVMSVFILPPSYDVWKKRLMKRYKTLDDFHKIWPKRRESAIKEIKYVLSVPYYDFIINDDINIATDNIMTIVNGQKMNNYAAAIRIAKDLLNDIENSDI
jgi:guanylate kinase